MSLPRDIDRAVEFVLGVQPKRVGLRYKPHKPCLLLAVLDLFEAEVLDENQIEFDSTPRLVETFNSYFDAVALPNEKKAACWPFVHLASDKFWHLEPVLGCEQAVREKPSKGGVTDKWVRENVRHVRLNSSFFSTCSNAHARNVIREAVVEKFFSDQSEEIRQIIKQSVASIRYELALRNSESSVEPHTPPNKATRSASFRRIVLDAYDYRCAATGWRIVLPSVNLIEAAHLIPWSESNDDTVQNGMALTPTYHRAMDANLIAPSAEGVWKISEILRESRIKDFEPFRELEGKKVILPTKIASRPKDEALQYRELRLRDK
ncbi:MAG: HNH endonuclease [Gammaproteobacteria bacterium]|nr:HNH endonuclease [Gammaproteobacteria bacterium]